MRKESNTAFGSYMTTRKGWEVIMFKIHDDYMVGTTTPATTQKEDSIDPKESLTIESSTISKKSE